MNVDSLATQIKTIEFELAVLKARVKELGAAPPQKSFADLFGIFSGKVSYNEEAIEAALENCSPTSFAHFWEDAILEPGDRQEEVSMRRRQVLVAMAEVLKTSGSVTKEQIIGEAARFGMDELAVERELQEFVHRQVLVEREGFYHCKIPFFSRWLREVGFLEISTTFTDWAAIKARQRDEERARVTADEVVRLSSGSLEWI